MEKLAGWTFKYKLPIGIVLALAIFWLDYTDTYPRWLMVPLYLADLVLIGWGLVELTFKMKAEHQNDSFLDTAVAYLRKEIAADTRPSPFKETYLRYSKGVIQAAISNPERTQPISLDDCRVFVEALAKYNSNLPAYVAEPRIFDAKLASIPHYKAMEDFHFAFKDNPFFNWLYIQYQENWFAVKSGVDGKFYEWGGKEFYQRLETNLFYKELFDTNATVPITIPDELRFRGTWVVAPQGKGKTTLLSALLKADLERVKNGGASVILIDSKGDLIDHARQLPMDRIVLIEPTADLAINPLDLGATGSHTIDQLEYLFSGLFETAPTEKQLTLLRTVLLAMAAIPNATIFTMRELLSSPLGGYKDFDLSRMHPDDLAFFTSGKFDSKSYMATRTEELDWRIQSLITKVPLLRDMFKAPHTKLDLAKEMDAGKLIIVDNSEHKLGKSGSAFFGRFFVAMTLAAAQQRQKKDADEKLPTFLYIDECDTVIARDNNIAEMIVRCRSQKIGVVLAHQLLSQIKSMDVRAALANCAVRFANSDDEAPELAARMRTTPEHLRSLHTGQFALFMSDLTKEPLTINVPNNPVSKWPKIPAAEMAKRRLKMKELYCYQQEAVQTVAVEEDTSPQPWKR